MFRAADSRGVSSNSSASAAVLGAGQTLTAHGTELTTVHQNTITIRRIARDGHQSQHDRCRRPFGDLAGERSRVAH
jgi:hypothetical protein